MKEQRSALLRTWLKTSVIACQETVELSTAIEDTQSAIGMELASWHELMQDLDDVERKIQEHADVLSRTSRHPEVGSGGGGTLWVP